MIDLINIRHIDLSPLSRSKTIESIGVASVSNNLSMLRRLNLAGLHRCPALDDIHIDGPRLDELDLSPLDGCESLQRLRVGHVNTHVEEDWESFLNKESTEIVSSRVDSKDKMLDLKIPRCPNLQEVEVDENRYRKGITSKFKNIDLTNLEYAPHLKILRIIGQGIFQLALSPLYGHQELSSIVIWHNPNLTELDISPLIPMGRRLVKCMFDKYIEHYEVDEEGEAQLRVGPPIKCRASENMKVFFDDFKRHLMAATPPVGPRRPDPIKAAEGERIDIEWY